MYGLLIQSIVEYIKEEYGADVWDDVRRKCELKDASFSQHAIYDEDVISKIACATAELTGVPLDRLMDSFGVTFVRYVGQFGFDRILKVLGRHMRDFLNGLDNLHEYLRFSYPKLKPPSFFCESENKHGLTLHYRSKRKGFLHYTKGQIREVGRLFYDTKIDIYVISEELIDSTTHVIFRLLFDNKAYKDSKATLIDNITKDIPLNSESLFELFPFHIVFNRDMEMRNVGTGLAAIMPNLLRCKLYAAFGMSRPLVEFTWEGILAHTNNVFEIHSKHNIWQNDNTSPEDGVMEEKPSMDNGNILRLKGQMVYISEWDSIMFLATPIMSSLDDMFNTGLYINDLSMHDSSRDLVLAGTQQSAELKLALDQEQEKSRLMEQSMQLLDEEMKRTDALLYQMIPKPVADRLRKGEPSVSTCQVFDNVTILFSDVVGFTTICSRITPMEVVCMLNAMYTEFDKLSEKHRVYKVETIGDAYMGVSGAPIVTKFHALHVCDMALHMVDAVKYLIDPSTGQNMQIRVGIHSGSAVSGVVGIKMPRYCLFGDTVNTAAKMETNGEAMKIHISEDTKKEIQDFPYTYVERGFIDLKGKRQIKTYWLLSRKEDDFAKCPFAAAFEDSLETLESPEQNDNISVRTAYSPVTFEDVSKVHHKPSDFLSYRKTPTPSAADVTDVSHHGVDNELFHIEDQADKYEDDNINDSAESESLDSDNESVHSNSPDRVSVVNVPIPPKVTPPNPESSKPTQLTVNRKKDAPVTDKTKSLTCIIL